jgi:hypothetical protein
VDAGPAGQLEWWRWRESNPRPTNSTSDVYRLIRRF